MLESVTATITQVDIDSGKPRSHCRCPIALALSRELKCVVNVHIRGVSTLKGQYLLPDDLSAYRDFINDYDNAAYVYPTVLKFTEVVPSPLLSY